MDSNYAPPSAEPPFDPNKYTPPSAEPPKMRDEVMPPSSEPVIIDVSAKETPKTPGFDAVPEGLAGQPPRAQTPPPPAKSNTARTIWIIVIVVLVVLCLCCMLTVGIAVWLYQVGGDAILDSLSALLPALAPWLV